MNQRYNSDACGRWCDVSLWNVHQEIRLRNARANQRSLEAQTRDRDNDLQQQLWAVEDRLERLLVVTDALWQMLSEEHGFTDEQLLARCAEIDAAGGVTDGRRPRNVRRCGACAAAVPHGRATCVYCGAEAPGGSALDRV